MRKVEIGHRVGFFKADPAPTLYCSCGFKSRFRVYLINHCYQNDRKGFERWSKAMHRQVEGIKRRAT